MLSIDRLAAYLEEKIRDAYPDDWRAKLYSASGHIYLKFRLSKRNKNSYSYQLYDADNQCLIRGASIHGLAAYVAPFVLRAFKEKEAMESLLLLLLIANRRTS